jgi:hypothetical protein
VNLAQNEKEEEKAKQKLKSGIYPWFTTRIGLDLTLKYFDSYWKGGRSPSLSGKLKFILQYAVFSFKFNE